MYLRTERKRCDWKAVFYLSLKTKGKMLGVTHSFLIVRIHTVDWCGKYIFLINKLI